MPQLNASTLELEELFERSLVLEEGGTEFQHPILEEEENEVDQITQEELDALFARDMYDLPTQEREQVLQDIHGVSDALVENPELIQESRTALDQTLQSWIKKDQASSSKTTTKPKFGAYQRALQQNPAYVQSAKLQLQFLRADRWDVRRAADRMIRFFTAKEALFEPDRLAKTITIEDLSKDDLKALESGFLQLLPVRDAAGRAIVSGIPMLKKHKNADNLKRALFYIMMTALEDEETQKSGFVMVGYNCGPRRVIDRKSAFAILSMRRNLPVRIVTTHYCHDDFKTRPMMTVAMLVMGASQRVRFRAHYGPFQKNRIKLDTYGIPTKALPINDDGEPKTKYHKNWLKLRREHEAHSAINAIGGGQGPILVVIPSRLDVLFGRGRPIQEHFGNLRYHALLDCYMDAYERAKKFDKKKIAMQIVRTVQEHGGRFLKQESAGWEVVEDNNVSLKKVAHGFRSLRTSALLSSASDEVIMSDTTRGAKVLRLSDRTGTNMATISEQEPAKRIKLCN